MNMTNSAALKPSRVVIVGMGAVGTTTGYTLMLRQRSSELVFVDVNHDKATGEMLDMNHGLPFTGGVKVWAGDYSDCKDADIIIITAGASQKPGETRIDLLKKNASIFKDIIERITEVNSHGILLIATNPVDILSYTSWKQSGWPASRVIGSGTLLDSARFRYLIGKNKGIDPVVFTHTLLESMEIPKYRYGAWLTLQEQIWNWMKKHNRISSTAPKMQRMRLLMPKERLPMQSPLLWTAL